MHKGENVISFALATVVVLAFVAVQRQWNPASLKDVAFSAEDFILTSAGIGGQVPDLVGYERLKTYRLGSYRAALYRRTPASLVFAPGRFVIYDRSDKPVFKLETLEGSRDPWTNLYDFNGHHGLPASAGRPHPQYTKNLTGKGAPDVVVGQYSGGDHCCTVVTIIELGEEGTRVLGRIDGLNGFPFEGLEIRDIHRDRSWECVAHRAYVTSCGSQPDAADVLSVYGFVNNQYSDQTAQYGDYLNGVLRQNIARWRQGKNLSLGLLQTMALEFAQLGQKDEGKRFFAMNFSLFVPGLHPKGIDPNACLDDLQTLVDRMPSIQVATSQQSTVNSRQSAVKSKPSTVNTRPSDARSAAAVHSR
jgi:hypothetical protein